MITQTLFFKSTDTNACSFGNPAIKWTVGKTTVLPKTETKGSRLCGPGLLHAATVPTETLVSHTSETLWPARLFTVVPVGELISSPDHPHQVAATSWRVV